MEVMGDVRESKEINVSECSVTATDVTERGGVSPNAGLKSMASARPGPTGMAAPAVTSGCTSAAFIEPTPRADVQRELLPEGPSPSSEAPTLDISSLDGSPGWEMFAVSTHH